MYRKTLVTLILCALIAGSLSACSGARSSSNGGTTDQFKGSTGQSAPPMAPAESPGGTTSGVANNIPDQGNSNQAATQRLVIRDAKLEIAVSDPGKAMDTIAQMANDMQGFVVTSNTYKTKTDAGVEVPEASITVRVPADRLDEALTTIKKLVPNAERDVITESVTGQDVTKDYTDLQSRLTNLEQAEQQLREIMASATKPEDVLTVFNQLTQVREQIEVIKGQIQYYEESARLSSISVRILAESSLQPLSIGGWQPVGVARDAIQAMLNGLKLLANAAIWLVLFALPIGVVIFIPLRLLWMLLRRLRGSRKGPRPSAPPAAPASK